jgi:hypothetical protein
MYVIDEGGQMREYNATVFPLTSDEIQASHVSPCAGG